MSSVCQIPRIHRLMLRFCFPRSSLSAPPTPKVHWKRRHVRVRDLVPRSLLSRQRGLAFKGDRFTQVYAFHWSPRSSREGLCSVRDWPDWPCSGPRSCVSDGGVGRGGVRRFMSHALTDCHSVLVLMAVAVVLLRCLVVRWWWVDA